MNCVHRSAQPINTAHMREEGGGVIASLWTGLEDIFELLLGDVCMLMSQRECTGRCQVYGWTNASGKSGPALLDIDYNISDASYVFCQ